MTCVACIRRFILFFCHSSNPVIAELSFARDGDQRREKAKLLITTITVIVVTILILPICRELLTILYHCLQSFECMMRTMSETHLLDVQ